MTVRTHLTAKKYADLFSFSNGKSIKPGGRGAYPAYGSNGLIGEADEFLCHNGIIIGRVGAYCGSVFYCPDRFWASDNTIVVKTRNGVIDTKFAYYLLLNANLNRYAGGAAQPLLTQSRLNGVETAIPERSYQERIASILSAYDDLIENNTRRIAILEEMARALYQEWFVHFRFPGHEHVPLVDSPLGPIPEAWEVKPASAVLEVNPKIRSDKATLKHFVPMSGLSEHSMLISDVQIKETSSGARFQNGDTLLARITPCLENGKTGYVNLLPSASGVAHGSTEFIVLRSR